MAANFEEKAKQGFKRCSEKADCLSERNEETEQFQDSGGTTESGNEKVSGKNFSIVDPNGNRGGTDENAGVAGEKKTGNERSSFRGQPNEGQERMRESAKN